jgi:hypothetical protein
MVLFADCQMIVGIGTTIGFPRDFAFSRHWGSIMVKEVHSKNRKR